ncbi:TPA: hypothetical protein N0F65_010000, partial [Lagenidium giganteum]
VVREQERDEEAHAHEEVGHDGREDVGALELAHFLHELLVLSIRAHGARHWRRRASNTSHERQEREDDFDGQEDLAVAADALPDIAHDDADGENNERQHAHGDHEVHLVLGPVDVRAELARSDREHDAELRAQAQAEAERVQALEEKLAEKERHKRRKTQQKYTKEKERDFRDLLFKYDQEVIRADKRMQLLTAFGRDDRTQEKQRLEEEAAARKLEEVRARDAALAEATRQDLQRQQDIQQHVQQSILAASQLGRRAGILPAINPLSPAPQDEQDETAHILVLRLSQPDKSPRKTELYPAASEPSPALPDINASNNSSTTAAVSSPTKMSNGKRLFFTANPKRFKHAETIRGESIGDQGGIELARSLLTGACPRVKHLSLGWNFIKYSGINALADSFVRGACTQLQLLDLRFNSIDGRGFELLILSLEKGGLPELLDISLQGNLLGDDGAKTLAHAMLRGALRGLRSIDIRQNRIRNAGVSAIWNVFTSECFRHYCPKLQRLDMRRNDAHGGLTRSFCPCPPHLEF